MRTSRLRSRGRAFGLIDAMVGLLILLLVAVNFSFAFQSLTGLTLKQADRADQLLDHNDDPLETHL